MFFRSPRSTPRAFSLALCAGAALFSLGALFSCQASDGGADFGDIGGAGSTSGGSAGVAGAGAAGSGGAGGTAGQGGASGSAGTAGKGGVSDSGSGCQSGLSDCNGACVDLDTDPRNCGQCGLACAAGESCVARSCGVDCNPLTACGPSCVDTGTSNEHCGRCDNRCGAGRQCAGGSCGCLAGLTDCGGACVDLTSDGMNCGQCGRTCASGQVCRARSCQTDCGSLTQCGTSCVDVNTNNAHCGACGNVCASGRQCSAGRCNCLSGRIDCNGQCVDGATDSNNCGACGTVCNGGRICANGSCACSGGQLFCNGQCRSTNTDPANCGACGIVCASGTCNNGSCATPTTGVIGWASVNGRGLATTTGGQGGTTVDVDTASELSAAASSSTRQIIRITATSALNIGELDVSSNKTLVGVGTNVTINGGININGRSNVIIQNLKINGRSSGASGDAIHIEHSHHVWIDHCDVWDAPDGLLDITNQSDLITVSYTRFSYTSSPPASDHRFSVLIGAGDAEPDDGYLNITFHHNYWAARVVERMPRVRFGQVHVFNNWFNSTGNNHCVRAAFESNVRVENNYFQGVGNPHEIDSDGGTATISASGNTYDGTSGSRTTRGTAFTPPYPYTAESASAARSAVMAGWGPR